MRPPARSLWQARATAAVIFHDAAWVPGLAAPCRNPSPSQPQTCSRPALLLDALEQEANPLTRSRPAPLPRTPVWPRGPVVQQDLRHDPGRAASSGTNPLPEPPPPARKRPLCGGGAGRRFRGGPSPPKRLQDGSGSRAAAGDSAQPAGRACAPRVKLWLPQLGDSSARVTRRVDPAAAAPRDCPFLGCRRKSFSLPLFFVGHGGWLGPFCRSSCSRVQMVWDHPDVFAACTVMAPLLPPCASGRGKLKQRDSSPRVQQEENPPHCTYSPSLPLSPT